VYYLISRKKSNANQNQTAFNQLARSVSMNEGRLLTRQSIDIKRTNNIIG